MTISTASNDYGLRNSSRIKYETIRNQTKRKQLLGKAQIRQRKSIQLIYNASTIEATKNYREKHNTIILLFTLIIMLLIIN